MRRFGVLILCLSFVLGAEYAFAGGSGPYFSYQNQTIPQDGAPDLSVDHFVFGYLKDNSPKRDKLYGHISNFGFDLSKMSLDVPNSSSITGYGANIKNVFAFGVVRTSVVRVWLGPGINSSINYYTEDDGILVFGVGAGPEVGVNIHLGDSISLGISGGYYYSYSGAYDIENSSYGDDFGHVFSVTVTPIFLRGEDKGSW